MSASNKISKQAFINAYCSHNTQKQGRRSQSKAWELFKRGELVAMPCLCGDPSCKGWVAIANSIDMIYYANILPTVWTWRELKLINIKPIVGPC